MLSWTLAGFLSLFAGLFGEVQGDTATINKLLQEHQDRTAKKINETTLDAAWKLVKKKKIPGLSYLELRPRSGGRKLRHGGLQGLQVDAQLFSDSSATTTLPKGYDAVDGAINMINDMISEADEKYNDELMTCCQFDYTQTGLINETRVAISDANEQSATCREEILKNRACVDSCNKQLPISYADLHRWVEQCTTQIAKLDHLITILKHDIGVIGEIILASGCSSSGVTTTTAAPSSAGMLLYECTDECGTYETVDIPGKNMTPHMREMALQLLTKSRQSPNVVLNMTTTTVAPRTSEVNTPCKQKRTLDPLASNCKLDGNSSVCPPLLEKFTDIQTGLVEALKEKQTKREETGDNCERVTHDYTTEIAGLETQLQDCMTGLAKATACKNAADEVARRKGIQLVEMLRAYKEMTVECHTNYEELENEICALTKIRMSVTMKLKGTNNPAFFMDCKVSQWVDVEPGCTVSCGGGLVHRHRTIEVYPQGGTKCPVLEAVASCNTMKCPIDCRVGDWSGWGDCSARECGGGVQDRTRAVEVSPMYGGTDCGETEEVRNCNVQACDAPCELSDWTAWTNCSKACNEGHRQRIRTIVEPATGEGECWDSRDKKRLQSEICNSVPCAVLANQLLQCQAKKDVVLLIDGSGSVGEEGWALEMKAAQMLRKAVDPKPNGSNMAVLVFSGPEYLCDYYYCVAATDTFYFESFCKSKDPDTFNCGIERVSDFTTSTTDLEAAIKAAKWPARTTFTAKALSEVESLMNMGEKYAETVVIVLTDGYPADKIATEKAAHKLNKKAKVIWVPITAMAPLDLIKEWAEDPEHVIPVDDFVHLDSSAVNNIMSTACTDLLPVDFLESELR